MRNRPVCLYSGGPQARIVFVGAGLRARPSFLCILPRCRKVRNVELKSMPLAPTRTDLVFC